MAPGWYFKKGKPKKVFPSKYNIRPKVRSSTQTPVARTLSEQKDVKKTRSYIFRGEVHEYVEETSGEGSAALYRDHSKSHGTVQHRDVRTHPRFTKEEVVPVTIFGEYRHVPESKRPPIVNAIYRRIQVKVEALNSRRTALSYWNHITPVDERYRKLFYFFSGNEGFFVERDYIQNRIRMSRDYESSSARVLIQREQWVRISWKYVEVTPSVDPPD
jgi:hypothetical protein